MEKSGAVNLSIGTTLTIGTLEKWGSLSFTSLRSGPVHSTLCIWDSFQFNESGCLEFRIIILYLARTAFPSSNQGGPYDYCSEVEESSNESSKVLKPNKFFRHEKMTCLSLTRQNASLSVSPQKRSAEQPLVAEKPAKKFISAAAKKEYDYTIPDDSTSSLIEQAKGVIHRDDNMNRETRDLLINLSTALTVAHEKIRLLTYVLFQFWIWRMNR